MRRKHFDMTPTRTRSSRQRATTLIEMLVVIMIIAVLAGVLLPSLRRSVQAATSAVCMSNLRQIGYALHYYAEENGGWWPYVLPPDYDSDDDGELELKPWFAELVTGYQYDRSSFVCPDDPFRYRIARESGPVSDPNLADFSSYGFNSYIAVAYEGRLSQRDLFNPSRPLDTMLVADAGPDYAIGGLDDPDGDGAGPSRNSSLLACDDSFDPLTSRPANPWITDRHGFKSNILTMTLGVRTADTRELMSSQVYPYYQNCSGGGCTFCNSYDGFFHYSFARDQLYWWTGPPPVAMASDPIE